MPNSLITKIQDGGVRHIEFRKKSVFGLDEVPPNLVERCITAMEMIAGTQTLSATARWLSAYMYLIALATSTTYTSQKNKTPYSC